jgi:hypothetical protein
MQLHLLAFEILQPAARSPYVKGWPTGRFFGALGQIRNLQPHRREIGECVDQPNALLRQRKHEDIMRRGHGPYQRRQMKSVGCFG